jgi:hypothetical protein
VELSVSGGHQGVGFNVSRIEFGCLAGRMNGIQRPGYIQELAGDPNVQLAADLMGICLLQSQAIALAFFL